MVPTGSFVGGPCPTSVFTLSTRMDKLECVATSAAVGPKMGMFVFIIVAVQIMLAGVYIIYKRRRNSMPKKFL